MSQMGTIVAGLEESSYKSFALEADLKFGSWARRSAVRGMHMI